jgi:RND family efflux transporter MFP subunit
MATPFFSVGLPILGGKGFGTRLLSRVCGWISGSESIMKHWNWSACGMVLVSLLSAGQLTRADEGLMDEYPVARTTPSQKVEPTIPEMGILSKWLVKEGDVVTQGQLLAKEDTDLEELELAVEKVAATSNAKIQAATSARDAAKLDYDRKITALANQGATQSEVDIAKMDYDKSVAELLAAHDEQEQNRASMTKQQRKIEKMQLLSPVSGIVESLNIKEGELVDPNKPHGAVTLVTNNPLWVDVPVPSAEALKVKLGDKVQVAYQVEPDKWLTGTVIKLNPEVDAASNNQIVRLELANDDNKPSGLWMNVKLGQTAPRQASAGDH